MKLILRADVDNLGLLGDVVNVKPGYGRNYLIPQGLAMLATEGNVKLFELERKKLQSHMDELRQAAMSLGEKVAATVVEISMRAGEGDKLYGSVTRAAIADQLNGLLGADVEEIDRKKILLEEPIRALGEYKITVRLHRDVQPELTVKVLKHGADYEHEEVAEEPKTAEEPQVEAAEVVESPAEEPEVGAAEDA